MCWFARGATGRCAGGAGLPWLPANVSPVSPARLSVSLTRSAVTFLPSFDALSSGGRADFAASKTMSDSDVSGMVAAPSLAGVGIFFQQDSDTNEVFVKTIVKGGSADRRCACVPGGGVRPVPAAWPAGVCARARLVGRGTRSYKRARRAHARHAY